jgi:hypothetical protein
MPADAASLTASANLAACLQLLQQRQRLIASESGSLGDGAGCKPVVLGDELVQVQRAIRPIRRSSRAWLRVPLG